MLVRADEAHRVAHRVRAAGAADAVDVVLVGHGEVVVHDVRDAGHVDPARGDVRGHKHADLPGLERLERTQPVVLRLVRVQRRVGDLAGLQLPRDAIRAVFRAGKNEHRVEIRLLQKRDEQRQLEMPRHFVGDLRHRLRGIRPPPHLHGRGLVEKLVRQRLDLRRERGGKKQRLPLLRQRPDDPPDAGEKAHVEHPVRLIEHEKLNARKVAVPPLHQVEQPAGARDDQLHAIAQRLDLRTLAHATENQRHAQREMPGISAHVFLDLHHQLARRCQHQHAHPPAFQLAPAQQLEHRQDEGRGLSRARLGDADDVHAGNDFRDCRRLDRRGFRVTRVFDRGEDAGFETEGLERHGVL